MYIGGGIGLLLIIIIVILVLQEMTIPISCTCWAQGVGDKPSTGIVKLATCSTGRYRRARGHSHR